MEKNTLYAIILSVAIVGAGFFIQEKFFAPKKQEIQQQEQSSKELVQPDQQPLSQNSVEATTQQQDAAAKVDLTAVSVITNKEKDPDYYRETELETDVFKIVFSNLGGVIKSIKLKNYFDNNQMLEMINKNTDSLAAFNLHMGNIDAETLNVYFDTKRTNQNDNIVMEFKKDIDIPRKTGEIIPLTIIKKYTFKQTEYLFELQIQMINKKNEIIQLDNNGFAYTLSFIPQIGPKFEKLDNKKEFRRYVVVANGKRRVAKMPKKKGEYETDERINWAGISGKYFAVIGIPDATLYKTTFSNAPFDGFDEGSRLFFSRPVIKSSNSIDTFRFYVGPKRADILKAYNESDKNGFSIKGFDLDFILDSTMLGWLQSVLKVLLSFFYGMVHNYGVAIILLTVFVKIVLFPLTHKSYESTSRMSSLTPKINEIKEKYKNNPQKMNQEVAALYKKEGINPLGGCLPLLLQMPIFLALYNLLNTHFELRGESFIKPWITDLSVPDSIFNFAPTSLPLLGSDIRFLPILMTVTQIFSSKIMQTPDSAGNSQMKMMMYIMPVMFLVILYDAPAGLLLYWTMTNILSIVQQIIVNKFMKKKKLAKNLKKEK